MNDSAQPVEDSGTVPVLHQPSDPLKGVVADPSEMGLCLETLAAGSGAYAIDVERAGGYRYSQRAYLVQIRREGSGTWLIDPLAFRSFGDLAELLEQEEWVLHAASQDLPSLTELGLRCSSLFDTELAGRLVGLPRVGLAAMTEHYLGYTLAKAHSAADWSTRPLPADWLTYAALDVEPLLELREHLRRDLAAADREMWAEQEFDWVRCAQPTQRIDPWRRVKGLNNRTPRALAIARELWLARDEAARTKDRAPSRVLPDSAIAALASSPPQSPAQLRTLPSFRRQSDSQLRVWHAAVERAQRLPEAELPSRRAAGESVPNHRSWDRINPAAARRLEKAREELGIQADSLGIARENLISPAMLRDVIWEISGRDDSKNLRTPSTAELGQMLSAVGARRWQVNLISQTIIEALAAADHAATQSDHPTVSAAIE